MYVFFFRETLFVSLALIRTFCFSRNEKKKKKKRKNPKPSGILIFWWYFMTSDVDCRSRTY